MEPQTLLAPASMVVTDLLCAHREMSAWKIVSSTHLLAQCHETGCDLCAQYIMHLVCGGNAGELSSRPPHLEQALDEAWPAEMVWICEDARTALHSEIEEVHRIIDEHNAQMATAKSDYTREKYNEEVSYQEHVKDKLIHVDDKIACLETRLLNLASVMMRSSSSSTKRKVDSPPPSD